MGKIIINNQSRLSDEMALEKVLDIAIKGYVSKVGGIRTYCAHTRCGYAYKRDGKEFGDFTVVFTCRPTKSGAHSFVIYDSELP